MKIPKILHYVWVGDKSKRPDTLDICFESWKKYCPDFEIKLWDEDNIPWDESPWLREARQSGVVGYASIADCVRFYALYKYGGIYVDCDYKFNRDISDLLENDCFFGMEGDKQVGTCIIGSIPGNPIIKIIFDHYNSKSYFDVLNKRQWGNANFIVSDILTKNGYVLPNNKCSETITQNGITFYSWNDLFNTDDSGYGTHLGTVLWYRNIVLFVPFKNHKDYITKFLDSVINTIGRLPIEIYMCDLGSFDGSREIVEQYNDNRIILRTITNKYVIEVFNHVVLNQGTGFLIMWCDIKRQFGDYKLNLAWEHYTLDDTYDVWSFTENNETPTIYDYIFKRESIFKKMIYKFPTHRYLFEMENEIKSHDMNIKRCNFSLYR